MGCVCERPIKSLPGKFDYNHLFIAFWDTASNVTGYAGARGVGGFIGHQGGTLVGRIGLFDVDTATDDFTSTPTTIFDQVVQGSCWDLIKLWEADVAKINGMALTYWARGPNSNSFTYTLLQHANLWRVIDDVNEWVRAITPPPVIGLPDIRMGPFPGWGQYIL